MDVIEGSISPLRDLKAVLLFLFFRDLNRLQDHLVWPAERQLLVIVDLGTLFVFLYIIVFIQSLDNIIGQCFVYSLLTV